MIKEARALRKLRGAPELPTWEVNTCLYKG
jgi:hypothetical protein